MKILGIETSCDETAAAVIEVNEKSSITLLSNVVSTSLGLHAKTGGIIPEQAAREQIKFIIPVIQQALIEAGLLLPTTYNSSSLSLVEGLQPNIDAIAVTYGPGLIGSLLVGVETAKTLSYVWNVPIIPVNHLLAHIYANWITRNKGKAESGKDENLHPLPLTLNANFPAIALIISGAHTDLLYFKNKTNYKWLGGTRDDAAGEAFDKIGRMLGFPYPAGPTIEKLSERGDASRFTFPRPMIGSDDFDFSFSGLKTAVMREVSRHSEESRFAGRRKNPKQPASPAHFAARRAGGFSTKFIANISASVQLAIIDVVVSKTLKAVKKYKAKSIILGGGVAANETLKYQLKLRATIYNPPPEIFAPQKSLCTDNAAMIAAAAVFNDKLVTWKEVTANPELYFN